MNLVRCFLSVFLLALLAISIAGWVWAGGQPSPKREGARIVLTLCGLSSVGCLCLLWHAKPAVVEPTEPQHVDST